MAKEPEPVDIPLPYSMREPKWWERIVYPALKEIQNLGLQALALIKALRSGKIGK